MKTLSIHLALFISVALLAGGCSTPQHPDHPVVAHTAPSPGGLTVRHALFGTGMGAVDVTARVTDLLRTEPQGFVARADWLRNDPRPYKRKALVIIYDYKGASHTLIVTDERINNDLLIKYATGEGRER